MWDPHNGYRYYSASQIDYLDTILVMKKIGFSLEEIRRHMQHYHLDSSLAMLHRQLDVIDQKIAELRLCAAGSSTAASRWSRPKPGPQAGVQLEDAGEQYLLCRPVAAPYSLREVSLASKQCFVDAFQEQLPVFFQSGVVVAFRAHPGGAGYNRGSPGLFAHRPHRPGRRGPQAAPRGAGPASTM